ncbi:MAG: hydroxymethylbilane synthase, partial [Clostridia bacterium]|nr:hydroxymethylbilane synthase [Clostridia bacterium]
MRTLTLATRASRLALAQAGLVQSALEALGQTVELVEVTTRGDRDRKSPLVSIGGQGLFVREVERCLLDGTADLAVHSGKDLPYELAEGLLIAGVPKAASPCDVLAAR